MVSPLMAKLRYFPKVELLSTMKGFSGTSPGTRPALITAVNAVEEEKEATRGGFLLPPHIATAIEALEQQLGYRFRDPRNVAAVLSHYGIASPTHESPDTVAFFRSLSRSTPPLSTTLPDCIARMERYSRKHLIDVCEDVYTVGPDHRSAVLAAIKHTEEQREATRAAIAGTMDAHILTRVDNVETVIGYRFRDPRRGEEALTHPSYLRSNSNASPFPILKCLGEGFIRGAVGCYLAGPIPFLNEGDPERDNFGFPEEVIQMIQEAAISTDLLARVAVRLGLWENSLHHLPAAVQDKVGMFQATVEKGEYDVKPPEVLSDLTGALGASVHTDCGMEVFYLIWLKNLFLQENPVFVMYNKCRIEGRTIFPSLTQVNGMFVVKDPRHNGEILGTGKTLLEAADAANKNWKSL